MPPEAEPADSSSNPRRNNYPPTKKQGADELVRTLRALFSSADLVGPAERVGLLAPLDPGQLVIQLLGNLTDLGVVDLVLLALVAQAADGGDDGGGADAPGLLERAVGGGLKQLVDADQALRRGWSRSAWG